jgi:N-acyl-D-aspartate/D-glutamate deacylase
MKYQGKRVSEVARMMNKADEIDALFDLVIADAGQTGAIYFLMSEDDVKLAMKQPWLSIGVDHGAVATTGPLSEGRAHPRGYGSFPRILGKYVRDERVITLEEAIRKMTSLAANRVGLAERGLLKPGYFADVVVFAHNLTSDISTFEDPNRLSTGMRFVLVNGQSVIDGGKQTMARPGRPLRGPGYKPPRPANR